MNHLTLDQFINIRLLLIFFSLVQHWPNSIFHYVLFFITHSHSYITIVLLTIHSVSFLFAIVTLFLLWIRNVFLLLSLPYSTFMAHSLSSFCVSKRANSVTCILTIYNNSFFQYPVASFVWCHFYCIKSTIFSILFLFHFLVSILFYSIPLR